MVEIFFEKERTAEHGDVDFEIEDQTLLHICIGFVENFVQSLAGFFLFVFFGDKKIAFKSYFDLYPHPLIIEFFWFA